METPGHYYAGKMEKITGTVPVELAEKTRNIVYWTPQATISAVLQAALEMFTDEYERKRGQIRPRPVNDLRRKELTGFLFGDIQGNEPQAPTSEPPAEEPEEVEEEEEQTPAPPQQPRKLGFKGR